MNADAHPMSLVAWGDPMDPRTFSGCSRGLGLAMRERGVLGSAFSAKQLRVTDGLRGAVCMPWREGRLRLEVRRDWMWSARGNRALTRRTNALIRQSGVRGEFFQVGTLIELDPDLGKQYALTDMTIPQAHRAGRFGFGGMSRRCFDEAVDVQRRVLRGLKHVFTFTEWARRSIVEEFDVDPDRVTTVYTGANHVLSPDPSVAKKPHQILFVGIDWDRKGGPQLVEGFRKLREQLPQAELAIVGCTPAVEGPGIHVVGYLHPGVEEDRKRLARLYAESACFSLMSDFEPLGNVICEAYSAGLPVVGYDSGSRREVIRDGQTGVLCSDREPGTIADALYRLLGDPVELARMSARARQMFEEELNWRRVLDKIEAVRARAAVGGVPVA